MFGRSGVPTKRGPTGQRMSDSSDIYGLWEPLYCVLRHLELKLDAKYRLPNSESRISNQVIAATGSTQRAQTSAERQHNRIAE